MENKKKNLIKEILRYLVAGGSAFVFDLLTKTLFHSFILPADMGTFSVLGFENEVRVTLATVAGFIVGLIVNYLISVFFVFTTEQQKERGKAEKSEQKVREKAEKREQKEREKAEKREQKERE